MQMLGRPTVCTPELIASVAKCIEDGLSIEKACDLNCICTATFAGWRVRGARNEQPFLDFFIAIKTALARRSQKRIQKITDAANDRVSTDDRGNEKIIKGDWQAQAWLEERQNRREFGRFASRVELSDPPAHLTEMQKLLYMSDEIVSKMKAGEITAEEAEITSRVLENRRKLLETSEYELRLREIESRLSSSS